MRVAIIGGGIAGLTAAWQLARLVREGAPVEATLFEASNRLGGLIETAREGGFTIETGPDAWLTAKPWASELASDLGLGGGLIPSNDADRKTWIYHRDGPYATPRLAPLPDGMTLMAPRDLAALDRSSLFSAAAIAAYRAEPARARELLASIPEKDESVASFTLRHFGSEVLERLAVPLLSGVFGGDVHTLSARATLPTLIQMERSHGSLIAALQAQHGMRQERAEHGSQPALFTTLRSGLGTLVDRLTAELPQGWLRRNTTVESLGFSTEHASSAQPAGPWVLHCTAAGRRTTESFDRVLVAVPVDAMRTLLRGLDAPAAALLPAESSSAVLAAFCFADRTRVPLPAGFGLLVAPNSPDAGQTPTLLQACTFTDQKFSHRVPPGGRLLRAYFGGAAAARLSRCNNDEIAAIARQELARILHTHIHASAPLSGPVPAPLPEPLVTIVRRLPASLPQYAVGHLDRVAQLEARLRETLPGLTLLGNTLHGLGLPDVIRDARNAARSTLVAAGQTMQAESAARNAVG